MNEYIRDERNKYLESSKDFWGDSLKTIHSMPEWVLKAKEQFPKWEKLGQHQDTRSVYAQPQRLDQHALCEEC